MAFTQSYIPYGAYWSTPFCRWQGSLAHLHPLRHAATVAREALAAREIAPATFDALHLGTTVPSRHSFYGAPWVAAMVGAEGVTGPTVSQACATSARVLAGAAMALETGAAHAILALLADRTSNGPHLYYPDPRGPGGKGASEDWVWDNFSHDPWAKGSMVETAENVAAEAGFTTAQQHELVLLRHRQYQEALADDSAFLRRFMALPCEVPDARGRKVVATLAGDEGVHPTTAEGLARLKPVVPDGTVTFASQTHPADGNCGVVVATRERARELSRDPAVEVALLAYGEGRARKGFMAQATVPAARAALAVADLAVDDLAAVKTHNPFAVNDLWLGQELDIDLAAMNNYGSSLIWGHPQAPTGARLLIELIEELVIKGGGHGLFAGCAAGDTAAALVVRVERE